MKYNTAILPCGLRVIHLPSASPVVYCGYEIGAGTSHEAMGEEGLAHFCEHVTFKGTERRNALQIINCLESVGGDLNAYTTKTDTVYYAALLKDHLQRAVDVLTDIVFHSTYPQTEIDKEVEVICDEIESYNDSPAELIYDDFENMLFRGEALGHNILGSADGVRRFATADALRFTRRHYTPSNSIFFAYGDISFRHLLKLLTSATASFPTAEPNRSEALQAAADPDLNLMPWTRHGEDITLEKNTHQAHVMLGNRAYPVNHPLRLPLYLLNNMLGGPGMSAVLNLNLREKHGLVYTVESQMVCYGQEGLWSVYFGCDPKDVNACLHLVRRTLNRFISRPVSAARLLKAKQQIKGQIGVACDNRENFALDFGKSFLHYGWEKDPSELFSRIDAITAEELQQVALDIFPSERTWILKYK